MNILYKLELHDNYDKSTIKIITDYCDKDNGFCYWMIYDNRGYYCVLHKHTEILYKEHFTVVEKTLLLSLEKQVLQFSHYSPSIN